MFSASEESDGKVTGDPAAVRDGAGLVARRSVSRLRGAAFVPVVQTTEVRNRGDRVVRRSRDGSRRFTFENFHTRSRRARLWRENIPATSTSQAASAHFSVDVTSSVVTGRRVVRHHIRQTEAIGFRVTIEKPLNSNSRLMRHIF